MTNSPLSDCKTLVESWQILRRHREIGVENHQHVATRRAEPQPHGIAFAPASLAQEPGWTLRVCRDRLFDRTVSVVRRMSLDEYQLRFNSHLRSAREHRGDVARFVAGRNDHRNAQWAIITALTSERACDHEIRQRQIANPPQAYEDAVRKRAENGNRQRTQDFLPRTDYTEVGQPEQVVDIGSRQPVLFQHGPRELQPCRDHQRNLPQPAKEVRDDACAWVAQSMKPVEELLDIPDIVQEVREHDDVECAFERSEVVRVGLDELQVRISSACLFEHRRRKVHPDASFRRQRSQQVSGPASDLEHPRPGWNDEPIDAPEPAMVRASDARAVFVRGCDAIPMRDPLRAISFTTSSGRSL